MKKIFLISASVILLSSFTLSPTDNCGQACADAATIAADLIGGDFDFEADVFYKCVDRNCNQQ